MREETIKVDGRRLELSRLDKLLFPDDGISKGDLVDYYGRIAGTALRHYRDRPLTMHRFPDGIDAEGFFQKNVPDHFPDWIERVRLDKEDGQVDHVLANNTATLVYLADQACITPHLALARADRPHHPDRMIFDLDPSDDDFTRVQQAAAQLKVLLDEIDMPAFVQTTGSRGLHVVVPLDRGVRFGSVREFAHDIVRHLAEGSPDLMTVEQRKNKRGKRVYLDVQRNAYGQTAVAPYAVRALPGAPVATPLHWHEAGSDELDAQTYHVGNLFRRLGQTGDPWRDVARHACSAAHARERFERRR